MAESNRSKVGSRQHKLIRAYLEAPQKSMRYKARSGREGAKNNGKR